MTTTPAPATDSRIDELAGQIAAARHISTPHDQRIGLGLVRLLGRGTPVAVRDLSDALGLPADEVEQTIAGWPDAFRDEDARITKFLGLSVQEMGNHRLHLEGRTLSTWCAWDTLFLPELLGEPARITSSCPTTGEPISLAVAAGGPSELTPAGIVVSFLEQTTKFDASVIRSFCHYVHFFASSEAADAWTAEHPGTFALPIGDAWRLAARTNQATFGAALANPPSQ